MCQSDDMPKEHQLTCTVSQAELAHLEPLCELEAVPDRHRFQVFVGSESDLDLISETLRALRETSPGTAQALPPAPAQRQSEPLHSDQASA
jgi:hypothetical protein